MEKTHHNFKKKYGQNFLQDKSFIKKIVQFAPLDSNDLVIEIGPGAGAMTKELVSKCKVLAYEIDKELEPILLNEVKSSNLHIIWDDFLNRNVSLDLEQYSYNNLYIIANLPYYITTPIISKIIEENLPVKEILIMVQREVADRFCSFPGNKEYGSITVYLNYFFEIKKIFNVSRKLFYPMPNVDSSVISLKSKEKKLYVRDEKQFLDFVRNCFKYKRKNIKNNLKDYDLNMVENILKKYGYDLNSRAEAFSLEIFVDLFNNL